MMTIRFIIAVLAMFGMASAARATPIASGSMISFAGGAIYSDRGISFLSNGSAGIVADTSTGSFARAFDAGCYSCAKFFNFSYANFVGPTEIYTATLGRTTTTLSLLSLSEVSVSGHSLELVGNGVLTLTGYDPTPGTFYLSSQAAEGARVSFSATSTAASKIPEPASMLLVGGGLLGAALIRRRKLK